MFNPTDFTYYVFNLFLKGMGAAGERPAKKRGGPWAARAGERDKELEEAKAEIVRLREKTTLTETKNEQLEERMASIERLMMGMLSGQANSQPSVTSVVRPQAVPSATASPQPSTNSAGHPTDSQPSPQPK